MAHEYITYTTSELKELFASVGVPGVIISIDTESEPKTCDVATDKWGIIEDVPFFYHCEDNTTSRGYTAFKTESEDPALSQVMLLVKNGLNNDKKPNPAYDEIKVVGFYDGKLRKCGHWEDWDGSAVCFTQNWHVYLLYNYGFPNIIDSADELCAEETFGFYSISESRLNLVLSGSDPRAQRHLEFHWTAGEDEIITASKCQIRLRDVDVYIPPASEYGDYTYMYLDFKTVSDQWIRWVIFYRVQGSSGYYAPKPLPEPDQYGGITLEVDFGIQQIKEVYFTAASSNKLLPHYDAKLNCKIEWIDFK